MCHCGKEIDFQSCCGIFLSGQGTPATAEELMRSRYSAFVEKNFNYLKKTTDAQAMQNFDHEANKEWAESVTFSKLEILNSSTQGNKAVVEFKAYFSEKKTLKNLVHHEISKFRQQGGVWYYRDGKVVAS